jgi:hypothetical protein
MRRSVLLTVAALGGLVCLLGGTVLFSALQDTARTGTNSAESAAMGASADIQLATATLPTSGPTVCGTFSENLTSGLISITEASPRQDFLATPRFCVKNVGSQPVTLNVLADELTDMDVACTGDEALAGDASCGQDQVGELSDVLQVWYSRWDCANSSSGGSGGGEPQLLKENATTPRQFTSLLAAGETGCFSVWVDYPLATPTAAAQKAQSDRATWRFKFTAQA